MAAVERKRRRTAADRVADSVAASEPVAVPSLRSLLGGLLGVVAQGGGLARETAVLGAELGRIKCGDIRATLNATALACERTVCFEARYLIV